jgi:hypothetical protein
MVTCEFIGRQGNNMFQVAAAYAIAEKFGDKAEFPFYPYFNLPQRSCVPQNEYVQPDGNNDIINPTYCKNLNLIGFFQRYELFDNMKEQLIKDIFKVPQDWQPNTICVHVRRGDFLNNIIDFPIQPSFYYMQALEMLDYKNKQVVFCSDDIPWCKAHFPFAEFREKTSALDDIFFGANCEAVVMSNSTLSFWMAYLNMKKRTIYFPLNWFSMVSGRNGYEICPKDWIGL